MAKSTRDLSRRTHGNAATYSAGCRCDPCRLAKNEQVARYFREHPGYRNRFARPTNEERRARERVRSCERCGQPAKDRFCSRRCSALNRWSGRTFDARSSQVLLRSPLFDYDRAPTLGETAAYKRAIRGGPCAYCGTMPCGGIDHIVPTSQGGSRDWSNLTGCCKRCNELKRTVPLILAVAWLPVTRAYHDMRRRLFA